MVDVERGLESRGVAAGQHLTTSTSGLVVGDFDGDGWHDLAQTSGNKWRYSRDAGSQVRRTSATRAHSNSTKDITAVVVGRFTADERTDAVRYELVPWPGNPPPGYSVGTRFVGWSGGVLAPLVQWSDEYVR